MSKLPGTELPQNALSPTIGTVKSTVDKKTPVPEIYLTNPFQKKNLIEKLFFLKLSI